MQILVIDDFVLVELALAQVLQGTGHTLTGVRDPRDLPEVLATAPGSTWPWWTSTSGPAARPG